MDETNLDWDDLRLFLIIARHGGLSPAARTTGKSAPTLGRRMIALERRMGRELFIREARGYSLTPDGRALLDQLAAVETRIRGLHPHSDQPPLVKISAGAWTTQVLCQNAALLKGPENNVTLRFISADHILDIARREAVIGIRNHRPEQIGLACRKVGTVQFAPFATDPNMRTWARVRSTTPSAAWVSENLEGAEAIEVTHPHNALDLALAGVARAILPTFVGDAHPVLSRLAPPIATLSHDQWVVTHHEDRYLPEVRGALDRIHTFLKKLHRTAQTPRPG